MRRWLSVLASCLLLASLMGAQTEDISHLKERAEAGDAEAQQLLGDMYAAGDGVPMDFAEAHNWWRKAEQGRAEAQLREAAEAGDAEAQMNLGVMYARGQGVTQDYAEAVKWYRKAAEQGLAVA